MLNFLQNDPLGRVYLANVHTAFKDNKPNIKIITKYLKSCNRIFKTTTPVSARELIDNFDNKDYIFKRTPTPKLSDNLTTVINIQSLNTRDNKNASLWLFTDNGKNKIIGQSRNRGILNVDIMVNKLSDPAFIKPDAIIGRKTQPLWVAPDTELSNIINKASIKSDAARNALGLDVGKDIHLIRFSIRKVFFENYLKSGKCFFSAPTFIEAGSYKYFRASQSCTKGWGRTRHLLDQHNPGIREAVTSPIPYNTNDFTIDHLNQTTTDPVESTDSHANFLCGKNRTWTGIIKELQAII